MITVLVPGIRVQNWRTLYNSIWRSCDKVPFEVIFIGPYEPGDIFADVTNVHYIQDWGTPIRCQQRGLLEAYGEYITWAADDGIFRQHTLKIAYEKLLGKDKKTLIMGKYHEGNDASQMSLDQYYYLSFHDDSRDNIPKDYLMLNVGLVPRELLIDVGGWDCQFEVCPMAYNDLAIRLQRYGVKFIIQNEVMFKCSHMPGHMGDHGPIHDAQTLYDQPLFKRIYSDPASKERIKIDIMNWEKTPAKWERRFGK